MNPPSVAATVLAALLGLAAGFGVGAAILSHPATGKSAAAISRTGANERLFPAQRPFRPGIGEDFSRASPAELARALSNAVDESDLDYETMQMRVIGICEFIHADNARAVIEALQPYRGSAYDGLITAILQKWASEDPAAALAFAEKLPGSRRKAAVQGLLTGWAAVDFEGAWRWVETMRAGPARTAALESLLQVLSQTDPGHAIEIAVDTGLLRRTSSFALGTSLFGRLAERDPRRAAEILQTLRFEGFYRQRMLENVGSVWASQDVAAAAAWAAGLPPADDRLPALNGVLQVWMNRDPDAALSWLSAQPALPWRDEVARQLVQDVNDLEKSVAVAELVHSPTLQDSLLHDIAERWGRNDPEATTSWVEAQTDPAVREALAGGLVEGLSRQEPTLAAELVSTMPQGEARTNAVRQLAYEWAQRDPADAARWASSLPEGAGAALSAISSAWARTDPVAAANWVVPAAAAQNEEDRSLALSNFAVAWAERDGAAATAWAVSLPPGKARSAAVRTATQIWTRNDLAGASGWVAGLSDPAARETASVALAAAWAESEPAAAAKWIEGQQDRRLLDLAFSDVSNRWARTDLPAAANWLDRMPAGAARDKALRNLAYQWVNFDPVRAREWIAGSTLDDATKRKLLPQKSNP